MTTPLPLRRRRPIIGASLLVASGIELFFSGQLDFGHLHIQLGIEGLQATVIPIVLVLLGVLAAAMPVHHVFYGVLGLALALYSLVGVNLGGFVAGALLGCVGGVLVVAWLPPGPEAGSRVAAEDAAVAADPAADAPADPTEELFATAGEAHSLRRDRSESS